MESSELKKYKIIGDIPATTQDGEPTKHYQIGYIQEVPSELGDAWVAQGLAELVVE